TLSPDKAEAVWPALRMNRVVTIGDLLRDPRNRERRLQALPLMLKREDESILTPGDDIRLEEFDRILFCGTSEAASAMEWILHNPNAFNYVLTGNDLPSSWLWRKLKQWRKRSATRA
ncbi:MAG: potassium transporter TrkA, partial [Gammaproteobacteria bacterium]